MIRYLTGRVAATVITLWLLATAGFLLVELIPGDPARLLAGPKASADTLQRISEAYGFDEPAWVRYTESVSRLATGDFGYSFSRSEDVSAVIGRSLPPTLLLTALAFAAEVALAIPLALFVVGTRNRFVDRALVAAAGATSAIPPFLVGLILLYLFAFRFGWLPLGGGGSPAAYVLPVASLAVPFGLVLARLLRTTLLEEEDRAYVTFALARGERPWIVRVRHTLPNAVLPLLSVLALDFVALFSSVAIVEVAFSIQGLGSDLFDALRRLDAQLIIGIGLVGGLVVAAVNLLADLSVIAMDPRVRR
jgi:peptide/nickel transport system permease protein